MVEGGGQLPHLDVWGSVAVGLLQLEVGGGGDVELLQLDVGGGKEQHLLQLCVEGSGQISVEEGGGHLPQLGLGLACTATWWWGRGNIWSSGLHLSSSCLSSLGSASTSSYTGLNSCSPLYTVAMVSSA